MALERNVARVNAPVPGEGIAFPKDAKILRVPKNIDPSVLDDILSKPIEIKEGRPGYFSPLIAFYIFFAAHIIAAIYSPIQDCDEVFNYWEPTHYLTHGYGFQTWEYSPDYAIRSWTFVGIHAVLTKLARLIPIMPIGRSKIFRFYFLRILLGLFCAGCEARLFTKISKVLNHRVGVLFMIIMLTSPGMFHASVSYLPSTFTMNTTMLGMAAFIDWTGGIRTAQGIMWMLSGSLLGWPFAIAMIIPFAVEEIMFASMSREGIDLVTRFLDGTARCVIVLIIQTAIDVFFYRVVVCVPLNIVWYNVVAASAGKGPNIYGVEPWHFYIRNLLLNFNIWFLVALVSLPLLLVQELVRQKPVSKQSYVRTTFLLCPFYLWLAIFTLQPHKEERFMYPLYPALALNAAIGIHIMLTYLGSADSSSIAKMIPARLRLALVSACFLAAVDLGLWRTLGMVTAYGAPLNIYAPLRQTGMTRPGDSVCLGKEWYRFPSSYHLPDGVKAKLLKSEFSGLLPGEFSEAVGFGLFPGAHLTPNGMNDENKEDPGKYSHISQCTFLVDSSLPGVPPTALEPDYVHDDEHWERIACEPFMDASRTGIIGRLGWVPDLYFIPEKYKRQYGEYCLLRRRKNRV